MKLRLLPLTVMLNCNLDLKIGFKILAIFVKLKCTVE